MIIKNMFIKDIERPINGVIKVGQADDENVYQELDEYVVTREIRQYLSKFYDNYQKGIDGTTAKMGVWISGFFGSGKSHFLKILSYLLENKKVNEKEAIDYFQDKIGEDSVLFGDMKRVSRVNTEVILFNIDAKSSIGGKSKEDSILKVFLKVFNEHQGFYGDIPGVAQMEKYLTREGKYEAFQEEFEKLSGQDWISRRRTFYFDADYVVGALSKATSMSEESARDWYSNGVKNYQIDIAGFAKEVKEYIDSKGKNFHLVFLVDEVGQYIGDDNKLMLNLQTITEELGTHCGGKVWVMVTSQEAIDELSKNIKGDDFSKIQGRFDTKLLLTSISVDEVIKKRILEKKDFAGDKLKQIYFEKSAILKNIIDFKDNRADLRGYEDESEFAMVYPFIPYQFKLLQSVFEQVRKHGSSGKHLSEGERSMLSAFKESALIYKDCEEGVLIPFYAFYETIKEFLNPSISRVIDGAYLNPKLMDDPFNMDLLKVLFMIKYIGELPASVDNLATLMITHIDEDKRMLKDKIIHSLSLLTGETLIQKNGDVYIFLTDDEQDINREIKNIKVDEDTLKKELRIYMFEDFYAEKRYRFSKDYDFNYNRKMDEKDYGNQTAPIGINIISPLSDNYNMSETELRSLSFNSGEMIIKLPDNTEYIDELEEVIRIDEYTKRRDMRNLPENIQNILNSKKGEEKTRRKRAKEAMEEALKNASFYINSEKADIKGASVKEKINNALKILVESVYTKLSYVRSFINKPEDIAAILSSDSVQIGFGVKPENPNELALKEVLEFIYLQNDMNKQVRVKIIQDRFKDKPYGWNEIDISGIIAELLRDQKIYLRYNGEYLEPSNPTTIAVLTRISEMDRVIVTKRVRVDQNLIKTAKKITKELWNKIDISDDEDGLAKDIKELISRQLMEIKAYLNRYEGRKYPGKSLLEKGLEYFEDFETALDNASLFAKLEKLEEDLLLWEEDMSYVRSFFQNQKEIFDKGLYMAGLYKENKDYLSNEALVNAYNNLLAVLEDYVPYRKIKDIPEYVNLIETGISNILREKKEETLAKIEEDFHYLNLLSNQDGVLDATKGTIIKNYNSLKESVANYNDILKIEGVKQRSQSFREKYEELINKEIEEYKLRNKPIEPEKPEKEIKKEVKRIKIKDLLFVKSIKTEEDVDALLNEISKKLKGIVKENKDIEFID